MSKFIYNKKIYFKNFKFLKSTNKQDVNKLFSPYHFLTVILCKILTFYCSQPIFRPIQ